MIESSKSAARSSEWRSLNYQETYICPVCRHGHILPLTLMDAFACDFCRHIFTANLRDQTLRVEDSSQPTTWRWTGRMWQAAHQLNLDLTITIWLASIALVVLPPSLIWLSSYTFPPLEGSRWSWFPTVWVSLAFTLHFLFVTWLLVEHYQVPLYVAGKVRLRQWFGQR
ncbi:hypothetical protein H6F43_00380 [Leptolyngbya sp. FACHB-36]|uniref:hypothetical protein n=1 Tax=Leptolyngbya sp. FACHB-36 TaxID=2692808 RepID=UPI0016808ABB|nr:hypothetical protein [Leptolyngbya sp. FACHB-36]MBD2018640.1 hypothetical protein [Leptolyngbya sp. FACHB-36]